MDTLAMRSGVAPRAQVAKTATVSKARAASFKTSFAGRAMPMQANRAVAERAAGLTITCGESRIGKVPVTIPKGVSITLKDQHLKVKGPNGELERTFPSEISVKEDDGKLVFKKVKDDRKSRQLHGLCRTLGSNMVEGVSEGFSKTLSLIGVGYRASVSGKTLVLNLGYSHPVEMLPPDGVTAKCEGNTTVVISGADKEQVGNFAAIVRAKRPPEVYKGKGVRYHDEVVILKEGKSGK